ncbi:hypothetical protein BB560_007019 [Smittium megazygosporum]|uniref:Phosphomannomutase n=1 Tax=Smittium megazygosporum TaxID=133381 RepID=A0A2T9XZJ0_9FUNG|nr:hypothetical protein BB560_007019 [Smittium megazygosporum]
MVVSPLANPAVWKDRKSPSTLCLFDVDGTLTPSRNPITESMKECLVRLRKVCPIGFVGGSNLPKQLEQLGPDIFDYFDFCFSENGLVGFRLGQPLPQSSFIEYVGEERYKKLVNHILRYIADLDIPIKRGTFIEFRNGMINVSAIGRNCTQQERKEYEKFDLEHDIRKNFVQNLKDNFPDYGLQFSIGGEISFDIFPVGWDKTFCLKFLEGEGFDTIHFFGDKTMKGGNDYEIYTHDSVIGHSVKNPDDTLAELNRLFGV